MTAPIKFTADPHGSRTFRAIGWAVVFSLPVWSLVFAIVWLAWPRG